MLLGPNNLSTLSLRIQGVKGLIDQLRFVSEVSNRALGVRLIIELLRVVVELLDELKL